MKSEMPCLDDDVPLVDVERIVEGFQRTHAAHRPWRFVLSLCKSQCVVLCT